MKPVLRLFWEKQEMLAESVEAAILLAHSRRLSSRRTSNLSLESCSSYWPWRFHRPQSTARYRFSTGGPWSAIGSGMLVTFVSPSRKSNRHECCRCQRMATLGPFLCTCSWRGDHAMGCDCPALKSQKEKDSHLFSKTCRPVRSLLVNRGVMRPARDANHSSISRAEIKNEFTCTSTPQCMGTGQLGVATCDSMDGPRFKPQ